MASRLQLQTLLEATVGSSNVYFQPPEGLKMNYPCIVYARADGDTGFADDVPYIHTVRYNITVIDKNPDSIIPGKVALLPTSRALRHFTKDNLNHDVYQIYY